MNQNTTNALNDKSGLGTNENSLEHSPYLKERNELDVIGG